MCVIFACEKTRPTKEMIDKGFTANPSGGGAAWREDGKVKWAKGLSLEEIQALCDKIPLPYVAHFRIPTCGGSRAELCHPFPIQRDVPLTLKGVTTGAVLFHNGHWSQWKDRVLNTLERRNKEMPGGRWSDTRAMAFYAAYFGVSALEMMDEKCVAFGPKLYEIYGSGWTKVNDIWCSNTHWDSTATHGWQGSTFRMCKDHRCTKNRLPPSEYCYEHKHLDTRAELDARSSQTTMSKSGGTSAAERFREGTGTVRQGGDWAKEVEQVAAAVAGGGEGDAATPRPLGDALKEGEKVDREGSTLSASRRDEDTPPWFRAFNPKRYRSSGKSSSSQSSSTGPVFPDADLAERRREADKGIERVGPL